MMEYNYFRVTSHIDQRPHNTSTAEVSNDLLPACNVDFAVRTRGISPVITENTGVVFGHDAL